MMKIRAFLSPKQLKSVMLSETFVAPKDFKKNEYVLNIHEVVQEIRSVKRKVKMFPFKVDPSDGMFCIYMTNLKVLANVSDKYKWEVSYRPLESFWFQQEAEMSKQQEFFSYVVIGTVQYFINHWVEMKAVYEKELRSFIGKIVEMENNTKYGNVLIIKIGRIGDDKTVRETQVLRRILLSDIFEIAPLRFIRKKNGKVNDISLQSKVYVPKDYNVTN